jgi:hypothetical protein
MKKFSTKCIICDNKVLIKRIEGEYRYKGYRGIGGIGGIGV